MKRCINWWQRRSKSQQQWLWFIGLWCAGFLTVAVIAKIIKLIMGV